MSKQIVVLTGMHRSGTSLVASVLQKAGVHIGRELLAPDDRNPRGFFEDVGFYEFHERALLDRGTTPYVGSDFVFEATSEERDKAAGLVADRAAVPLWGWKDPRTSLFLDFWREMLPEARFLFVYRHPLEVLVSLVRREEAHTVGLLEGLTAWTVYNSRILAFRERHPNACLLCHTYAAVERIDELGSMLASRWGIRVSLGRSMLEPLYHPEELRRLPGAAALDSLLRAIHPESLELYESLERRADLSRGQEPKGKRAEAGSEIEALARAIACLAPPHPPSRARGLLLLLLGGIDPALLDRYFAGHGRYVLHVEQDRTRLQSALDAEAETVRRQAEWIETVEANNRAKQELIETQEAAVGNQKKWIETLEADNRAKQEVVDRLKGHLEDREAELRAVYGSLSWRVGRRLAESAPWRLLAPLLRRRRGSAGQELVMKREKTTASVPPFEAELPAGEMKRILQRIEENLAVRRVLKGGEAESVAVGVGVPPVPPLTGLDERQQALRRLRAPFFVPEGGGLGALFRRLLNVPLRIFGHKQVQFNEQVIEMTTQMAANFHQSLTDQRHALAALADEIGALREEVRKLPERPGGRPDGS